VEVSRSDFHQLSYGIQFSTTGGIKIVGNRFREVARDAIQAGAAVTDVLIDQNSFYDFQKVPGAHADAVQFMTVHSVPDKPSRRISITNNLIWQRHGSSQQGVFLGNEKSIPYEQVTIEGNLVLQRHNHAIRVARANGARVQHNAVYRYTDYPHLTWINVSNAIDAEVSGNSAPSITVNSQNITNVGNHRSDRISDDGESTVRAWMEQRRKFLPLLPDIFQMGRF
jgi:hypothetical protein